MTLNCEAALNQCRAEGLEKPLHIFGKETSYLFNYQEKAQLGHKVDFICLIKSNKDKTLDLI